MIVESLREKNTRISSVIHMSPTGMPSSTPNHIKRDDFRYWTPW
ncbi:hypothetical protein [Mycobacteroides chelonae]|nr:hypothetical protein [Mycobacteroides chelonae]